MNKLTVLLLLCSMIVPRNAVFAGCLAPSGIGESALQIRFDQSITADEKVKLIVDALNTLPHPNVFAEVIEKRLQFISRIPVDPEYNNSLWLAATTTPLFLSDALFGLDTLATNIDENALMGAVKSKHDIADLIKTYRFMQTGIITDDLKNPSARNVFNDLIQAVYIMGHGGPLQIDYQWGKFKKHAQALINAMPDQKKLTELLFYKTVRAGDIIVQPLDRLKDRLGIVIRMFYHSDIMDNEWMFAGEKCKNLDMFGTPNLYEWIKQIKNEYLRWLEETEKILTEIRDIIQDNPFLGDEEHVQYIYSYAKHYRQIVRIMRAFLSDELPDDLKEDITDIDNLNLWLKNQTWESKDKEYDVRVEPSDVIIPLIGIHSSMLALAKGRLISNGFHAIERNEKKLSPSERIVTIKTDIRTDDDGKKYARITIINPGSIDEEKLEIDEETRLPKLFVMSREKEDMGGGLKFAVRVIQKMGGTVSVENKKQHDRDTVEFAVEFPLEHPPAKKITASTRYQTAWFTAQSH